MIYGYARVSTEDQEAGLGAQVSALEGAGVAPQNIFIDRMSGTRSDRPEYRRLVDEVVQPGDKIVFLKPDRLGRSVMLIIGELDRLAAMGIETQFLDPAIDTTTSIGRAMMQMIAVFAEMERNMISDRTKAALGEIKRTGRKKDGTPIARLGRPPVVDDKEVVRLLGALTPTEVSRRLGIGRSTVYRIKRRSP